MVLLSLSPDDEKNGAAIVPIEAVHIVGKAIQISRPIWHKKTMIAYIKTIFVRSSANCAD